MDASNKFKFIPYSLTLKSEKELLNLKKMNYKVKKLSIPIKGSSNVSEYKINTTLKQVKHVSNQLKTLRTIKTNYISDEFMKLLMRGKQALKGVSSLIGNFSNLQGLRKFNCFTLLNLMPNLSQISDLGRFSVNQRPQAKSCNYNFPGKLSRNLPIRKASASKVPTRKLHPLRKVKSIQFSPNLNFNRLFSSAKQLKVEAVLLPKISALNLSKVEDLVVDDRDVDDLDQETLLDACEVFKNLISVNTLRFVLTESDSLRLLEAVKFLPIRRVELCLDLDFDLGASEESPIDYLRNFVLESKSSVLLDTRSLCESENKQEGETSFLRLKRCEEIQSCNEMASLENPMLLKYSSSSV